MAAAAEQVRAALGLDTLEDRKRDGLDFHEVSVASIRRAVAIAFDAGWDAGFKAGGLLTPTPAPTPKAAAATDPDDMLATLVITRKTGRATGGTWVKGTIAGHGFEALVFPDHAESAAFELADSRISKLWLRDNATKAEAACFDRGWDTKPKTPAAKAIVDLLAAGLAETVFGK